MSNWLYRYTFAVLVVTAIGLTVAAGLMGADWKVSVAGLGTAVSLVYALQAQRREETRLFKDLFTEFNERYDKLNSGLNEIRALPSNESLTSKHLDTLYDYFNLCGEEYLFYRLGYIRQEAWDSWLAGMEYFYSDDRIGEAWRRELRQNKSYYSFDINVLSDQSAIVGPAAGSSTTQRDAGGEP